MIDVLAGINGAGAGNRIRKYCSCRHAEAIEITDFEGAGTITGSQL